MPVHFNVTYQRTIFVAGNNLVLMKFCKHEKSFGSYSFVRNCDDKFRRFKR